jgi:8-oxo-dGDP phosphatase
VAVSGATGDELGRWRTFGERTIYDDPSVWLGQVDVELPNGERVWNHVVRMHRAVTVILLDDQDQVLLLWRYRFVKDRIGGELPGGLVDDGEDPADAAVRELEEQTGYRAGRLEPVMTFEPLPGIVDAEHVVFEGRDPERVTDPVLGAGEIAGVGWLPVPAVTRLIAQGRIWNAESLVPLLRLLAPDL